jgi:hypothetical protein
MLKIQVRATLCWIADAMLVPGPAAGSKAGKPLETPGLQESRAPGATGGCGARRVGDASADRFAGRVRIHLEILRQREIYQLVTTLASEQRCQVIAASHSEVLLNEAADRDIVIAFVGKPHRIDDRGSQVLKALKEIGFEHYYLAEQTGWVLYLEGATDLEILRSFASHLVHPAAALLERPFVYYVGNQPGRAREHFYGLREAKTDLAGIALYDRIALPPGGGESLIELTWRRREIENYLCYPEVLEAYAVISAELESPGPLFAPAEAERRLDAMRQSIRDLVPPLALRDRADPWWRDTKASDEFLDRLFALFFQRLGLPNLMRKTDYHVLARLVPASSLDSEIGEKLDALFECASRARPLA